MHASIDFRDPYDCSIIADRSSSTEENDEEIGQDEEATTTGSLPRLSAEPYHHGIACRERPAASSSSGDSLTADDRGEKRAPQSRDKPFPLPKRSSQGMHIVIYSLCVFLIHDYNYYE